MRARLTVLSTTLAMMAFVAVAGAEDLKDIENFVSSHCIDCHSGSEPEGSFDLESLSFDADQFSQKKLDTTDWEKILRRIDAREMPPASSDRPDEDEYKKFSKSLSQTLHHRSKSHPQSGRIGSVRRLTRTEYQNSIRDLLGIQIDASDYLRHDSDSC